MKTNQKDRKVTAGLLANLANERTLSTVFERAWQERTGVNPVGLIVKLDQSRRLADDRRVTSNWALAMAILGCLLVSPAFMTPFVSSPVWVPLAAGLMGGLLLIIISSAFASYVRMKSPTYVVNMLIIDEFLTDLNTLCEWFMLTPEVLRAYREECTKRAVHDQLVGQTREIFELEKQEPSMTDCVEYLAWSSDIESKRKHLYTEHNLCVRIGLASGGFDKWFEIAKRQMRQEAKKAKAAATA